MLVNLTKLRPLEIEVNTREKTNLRVASEYLLQSATSLVFTVSRRWLFSIF